MKRLFIIIAAIALVGAFTATAMAADWGFYGSSRMTTFYNIADFGDQAPAGALDTDSGLFWAQQGNSRIGANVAAGNMTGRFEYGTGVDLRILWAEYDFGGWKLGLGQHYTPVHAWVSSQVYGQDLGLLSVGGIYDSRRDMIRATFIGGALKVALVETSTTGVVGADTDVILPKIEARFDLPLGDSGRLGFMAGYNTVGQTDGVDGGNDGTIDSYLVGVMGAHNFGSMYFNWDAFYAQNAGNFGQATGWVIAGSQASAVVDPVTFDTDDATSMGALVVFGMSFSDMLGMEAGLGYRLDENDVVAADADDYMALYVQMPITIAQGFAITPEVGAYLGTEDGDGGDDVNVTYFGAKWQMNF